MDDKFLIRATAWAALSFYVASEIFFCTRNSRRQHTGWWLAAIGWFVLLLHIIATFHWRYGWEHRAAYADTARQTAALTGWDSGAGIYVNYTFAAVWLAWLVYWRIWKNPQPRHHRAIVWTIRGIFLFMIINAGVVFVPNAMRLLGVVLCVALIWAWFKPIKHGTGENT